MKKQFQFSKAALLLLFSIFQIHVLSAQDGTGVVTVTADNGSCIAFTPASGSGPDNWEVVEGGTYTMTITGVTECSESEITVFVQNTTTGNWCFNATGADGTYTGSFTFPSPTCFTSPISYKCGADQPCDNDKTYAANGPSNTGAVHFRSALFDGDCNVTDEDKDCEVDDPCIDQCDAPKITSIDSVCGNIAVMCWTTVPCATAYLVRWNVLPDKTWIYELINAPDTCRQFTNHFGDVNEVQVAAICENGDTSEFSDVTTWDNYLVCPAPDGLVTSDVTESSATFSWNAQPDANKYQVLYKVGSNKTTVKLNGTSLTVNDLVPGTTYKWKVKSRCEYCDIHNWGPYTEYESFTTKTLREYTLEEKGFGTMYLFPNPATRDFSISFNAGFSTEESYIMEVQDLVGHTMLMEQGTLSNGIAEKGFSLDSKISDGIYFVILTVGGKQYRQQLVVNND